MKTINIWYGHNKHILSNLSLRPFTYQNIKYKTVEHAYQTLKSGKFNKFIYDKDWKSGVKFRGNITDKQNNITLMANLMLESFKQNPKASKALKDTGNDRFTHNESKDIWKTTFPMLLEDIRKIITNTEE